MACLIGIDVGTTSTTGILLRMPGKVLGTATRPTTLVSPHPGWAEEDPEQWWSNTCSIIRELVGAAGGEEIAGIGVAGMLPAVVLLDADGRLLRPSIQQSDGRCGAEVAALRSEVPEEVFLERTGNGINQQLASCKLRWVERHEPGVFGRVATVLGSYDYINWRLTGMRTVERNWALESGFVEIATGCARDDLVALAHIQRMALPRIVSPHEVVGGVTRSAAGATGLREGLPVVGGAADLVASALAAGVVARGDVLLKFGGAIDVLTASDRVAPDPRMYTDYHLVPGLYMPNGCMSTGGSGLNWFASTFQRGIPLAELDRAAASVPAGSAGLSILPYFLGEKTPIHDPDARGVISGLSLSHGIGHLWRALLESYGFAIAHHVEVLNEMGHATERFSVSDGGSASREWMQIVSDILQRPLRRLSGHPGSCLGAAWAAAVGVGLSDRWDGASRIASERDVIEPDLANAARYREGYLRFRDLYRRVGSQAPIRRGRT